jgi:hypothetical protein
MLNTIVPLKSDVGVITKVPVVVPIKLLIFVAVNEPKEAPPKAIVNEPVVLFVTV